MATLSQFWEDKALVELVEKYFYEHLDRIALERVYDGGNVQGIADAKLAIMEAFKELDQLLSKDKINPPVNMAR